MIPQNALIPKNRDGVLRVLAIGRVSTIHQNESNIQAGYDYVQRHLATMYSGPLEVKEIGARESGMLVDRDTILEAYAELKNGRWDAVLMEDCSKSYRNPRWMMAFVQDCVDLEVRVIAPGDSLDTVDENWELMLNAAAIRHGMHIPDTRRRIRRTADHAFRNGGMVLKVPYGYRKLNREESLSGEFGPQGLRVVAVPEATSVINQMADRLIRGDAPAAIAAWLNDEGVPSGPYVQGDWTARLVLGLLRHPLLVGRRRFRHWIHRPIFATGKHRREQNPNPEMEHRPELAHLSDEKFEAVQVAIARRSRGGHQPSGDENPRHNVPRSRATFPHQHARCGACGRVMHAYGGGQLKCGALRDGGDKCWNHLQVKCELARQRIIPWVIAELSARPHFRKRVVDAAWEDYRRRHQRQGRQSDALAGQLRDVGRQLEHVAAAIAETGGSATLIAKLQELEQRQRELNEQWTSKQKSIESPSSFQSRDAIDERLESALMGLAASSFDLADLLRRILIRFEIIPVRRFDQNFLRPRARLTLLIPSGDEDVTDEEVQTEIDLFDPPVEIQHLSAVRQWKTEHPEMSLEQISQALGIHHMTAKRASQIARAMQTRGLTTPYVEVTSPPASASRWKQRSA